MTIKMFSSLEEIKGIGPKFIERLKKLEIRTVEDLLYHFPIRYDDFSEIKKIATLKIGEHVTIHGVINDIKVKKTWRRKMFIVEALISDETGSIKAIWFNARFLLSILKKGKTISLAGKIVESQGGGICLSHPAYEFIDDTEDDETKHTGRLVPVYAETKNLTSKGIRFLVKPILEDLEEVKEFLPYEALKDNKFPEINIALRNIHFPSELKEAKAAKKRFAFEDLFLLQLLNLTTKRKLAEQKAKIFETDLNFIKNLLLNLPFELTHSQKKSLWEILQDLAKDQPMNRLLQGDVGSGKTIIAAICALVVAKKNSQVAFMAPTEVLARQHFLTFKKFFSDFEKGAGLLTASETKIFYGDGLEGDIKKTEFIKKIEIGEIKIIFGTHALLQKNVKFNNLDFLIIDEQHRFGVKQRAELLRGKNFIPHLLSMSATPIPRTLTLTIFGDLDLSIIDELPKGRKKIITKIVAPENRDKAYAFIRGQVRNGRQVFVVCPRIDKENEESVLKNYFKFELKAVKEEYEKLSKKIFPDLRVAMLHGKMKSAEKSEIMNNFKNHNIDILVSTSVIEVGVDVPNATIMMIEGSERFGLAQLYQFRGRVGRGEHQSFCFLFAESLSKTTFNRLNSLAKAKNGFELAEKDLEIRGPGEFLGNSQTGYPDLAMKAMKNPDLVKKSRETAMNLLEINPALDKYPALKERLDIFRKEIHLE